MSSARESTAEDTRLDEYPVFELTFLFDKPHDPTEVTVIPRKVQDATTQWITIDADHAIPLDHVA